MVIFPVNAPREAETSALTARRRVILAETALSLEVAVEDAEVAGEVVAVDRTEVVVVEVASSAVRKDTSPESAPREAATNASTARRRVTDRMTAHKEVVVVVVEVAEDVVVAGAVVEIEEVEADQALKDRIRRLPLETNKLCTFLHSFST